MKKERIIKTKEGTHAIREENTRGVLDLCKLITTADRNFLKWEFLSVILLALLFTMPAYAAEDWPMLLPGSGWYSFDTAKADIRSVEFVDSYEPDGTEIAVKKVDNDCKGDIKAYLLAGRDKVIVAGNGSGGIYANPDCGRMFEKLINLEEIKGLENVSFRKTVAMDLMFLDCYSIETIDFKNFDTSNVRIMASMFQNCFKLEMIDMQYWDLCKVKDASYMFCNCYRIDHLQFRLMRTTSLEDISYMFLNCYELDDLDISQLKTTELKTIAGCFKNCKGFTILDLRTFETQKITDMSELFEGCESLENVILKSWDTSKVKKMKSMFAKCKKLKSIEINWDTECLEEAEYMYYNCSSLTSVNLRNFKCPKIKKVSYMFEGCTALEELDLSQMNFSFVEDSTQSSLFGDTVYPNLIRFQPPCGVKIAMSMPDTGKGHFYYNGEEMITFPRNTEEKLSFSVTHQVCFKDPEDETIYKEASVERGGSVSRPENPVKESEEYTYTFAGWIEEDGTAYEEAPVYSDLTYYASWDKVKIKIPETEPKPPEETEPQEESETPEETETKEESETPEETEPQEEPEIPEETEAPGESETPEETIAPGETETETATSVSAGSDTSAGSGSGSSSKNSGSGGGSSGGSGGSGGGGSGTGKSYSSGGGASPSGIRLTVAGASATFSTFWYADTSGTWRVKKKDGSIVRSSWLCDDAVAANGKEVWYLINTDGSMLISGLVQDNTGNFYSLETTHNGYYGMLRYKNGFYSCGTDTLYITFNHQHNGSFGAITNQAALDALKKKYGVTRFLIGNGNCVYTSTF